MTSELLTGIGELTTNDPERVGPHGRIPDAAARAEHRQPMIAMLFEEDR